MKNLPVAFFLIALTAVGCSYSFQPKDPPLLAVPYVKGDRDGSLTAFLAEALTRTGSAKVSYSATKVLEVSVVNEGDENIGFEYGLGDNGALTNELVANEARLMRDVEVLVRDTQSQKIILGPQKISAGVDFDFTSEGSTNALTQTSCGQLTAYASAKEAARMELNRRLSEKIALYVGSLGP